MKLEALQQEKGQEHVDLQNEIFIKGARSNNLKNIDIRIPKKQLVVVTGLSGSGKSSLIMDTLYAEGQRRYVESLSSYARQFLNRMKKPEVDYIKGICPAIAIEQKVTSSNARSTVGSLTEIYDYLRLLYARIGKTYSPISGDLVKKHQVSDVVNFIQSHPESTRIQLFIPLQRKYPDRTLKTELNLLMQKGFSRVFFENALIFIEDFLEKGEIDLNQKIEDFKGDIKILIDRFSVSEEEDNVKRIADSIQSAFYESEGDCIVDIVEGQGTIFNNRFELDGMVFLEPSHQLFNYNNPYGACKKCEGYGRVIGLDPNKVIPSRSKSVFDGAIACWKGEKYGLYQQRLIEVAHEFDFPINTPIKNLSQEQEQLLWQGNEFFTGLHEFFAELEEKSYKIQNRVLLARYRGRTTCPECSGGRLRKESTYVKIGDKHISELINIPIDELAEFFNQLDLSDHDHQIAKRILVEINTRLKIMSDIGLGYLTLDRLSGTLSGGETQRINLTRTLGSNLTNSLYILDEPSIGLHPKDTYKLVEVLKNLRNLGNTVVVVEHEEEVITNADYLIDIGPEAGAYGGELVFAGPYKSITKNASKSLTAQYLNGKRAIEIPNIRRKSANKIYINGADKHNLKNIDVEFPLNTLTVVTGVSGSGKTTLIKHILYPLLKATLGEATIYKASDAELLSGDIGQVKQVELINQNPIGKSSRSNPVTYVGAYDSIRKMMCSQQLAKIRGYKPKHFSFNVEGGRCEECKGEGEITVEMQFLADVKLTCEDCGGKRFKPEVLEVNYKNKNIYDILNMSIDEALEFFELKRDIVQKLKPLQDVGLGYVKLGQPSSTLSGGEAQRVKLASFLGKDGSNDPILFMFDEPTTGLHFHDIVKLMSALNALVENGHTVLVVEHNLEVIKCADWVIDLGPDGGKNGGHLVFQGTPEDLTNCNESYTGQFLKEKIK